MELSPNTAVSLRLPAPCVWQLNEYFKNFAAPYNSNSGLSVQYLEILQHFKA